jgi:transmembrane sensor
MTDNMDSPPRRGQLRDEAADWFAVMRGPEADARRAEFEAWLAGGELHRAAYNKIAETFSLGKGLKALRVTRSQLQPGGRTMVPPAIFQTRLLAGAAAVIFIIGGLALGQQLVRNGKETRPAASADLATFNRELSTPIGSSRTFALPDGSAVALDGDSLVQVSLSGERRNLHFVRGRGRFIVAHDGRPFTVVAAGGTVTARGTVFDVAVDRRHAVTVSLLEGRIDVTLPRGAPNASRSGWVVAMKVGEVVGFRPTSFLPGAPEQARE